MYHDYCIIQVSISFSVLMSGRPLPVTTFFVFSKPFCSTYRDLGIFCTAATALFIAVKALSLQRETVKICYCCSQLFCSTSWSHSAACFVQALSYSKSFLPINTNLHFLTTRFLLPKTGWKPKVNRNSLFSTDLWNLTSYMCLLILSQ